MSMKEIIADVFGIKTYEAEYISMEKQKRNSESLYYGVLAVNERLKKDLEETKALADAHERANEELRRLSAEPIAYINEEVQKLESQYRECLDSCEALVKEYEERQKNIQLQINRARAEGYKEAYVKMGITALNARMEKKPLYFDVNTLDVVTVEEDAQLQTIIDEIEIDDLVDVVGGDA